MRRIFADDADWTLSTVPDLVELTIRHIVANFASQYDQLPVSRNDDCIVVCENRNVTVFDKQFAYDIRLFICVILKLSDSSFPRHCVRNKLCYYYYYYATSQSRILRIGRRGLMLPTDCEYRGLSVGLSH